MLKRRAIGVLLLVSPAIVAAQQPQDRPANPDKKVCKTIVDTGSLAGRRKVCHSARDWQRLSEASRKLVQEMQTTTPGQTN
jgi:hypothetical protein